jgi:hypothetical protein
VVQQRELKKTPTANGLTKSVNRKTENLPGAERQKPVKTLMVVNSTKGVTSRAKKVAIKTHRVALPETAPAIKISIRVSNFASFNPL